MDRPSRAASIVNGVAFWLVLAMAMLASCAATMPGGCTKEKAYITAAKSDLRIVLSLQESFREQRGHYGTLSELEAAGLPFRQSTGVQLSIHQGDAGGFRARAIHHQRPGVVCSIDSVLGEPRCVDVKPARRLPKFMSIAT